MASMSDKLILVTNDDGVFSPGLETLARAASKFGRAVVVAPDRNRSGVSSAMTVHSVLRLDNISPDVFACDGTPVDCVLLGVRCVLEREPDWILSGVNCGFNVAEDVFYSGTVGAAFEGCMHGARCAAFSLHRSGSLETAYEWIERFLANWEKIDLPANSIWNVNMPEREPKGFRLTAQGMRRYSDLVERRHDPTGKPYFWIGGGSGPQYDMREGTDTAAAVNDGFISLTPLHLDLTCRESLSESSEIGKVFSDKPTA